MILNDRQLSVTRGHIATFSASLERAESDQVGMVANPKMAKAYQDGLKSILSDLRREEQEYLDLRAGELSGIAATGLQDIANALIKHRIARGMSQADLAGQIDVVLSQVEIWEAEEHQRTPLHRLMDIARVLGLDVAATVSRAPAAEVEPRTCCGGCKSC